MLHIIMPHIIMVFVLAVVMLVSSFPSTVLDESISYQVYGGYCIYPRLPCQVCFSSLLFKFLFKFAFQVLLFKFVKSLSVKSLS